MIPATPFITIDPGITGTGWAIFDAKVLLSFGNIYPRTETKAKTSYIVRSDNVINQLKFVLFRKATAYIEEPAYMSSSYVGQAAADSGALVKLVWHYGRIWQLCHALNINVEPVSIAKWKGQLPKNISHNRTKAIMQRLNYSDIPSDHALDAIGIGFYLLGVK